MQPKLSKGIKRLSAKALAVITAALSAIGSNAAGEEAAITTATGNDLTDGAMSERAKILKPQLVLKLNIAGNGHLTVMHTSHRSHSSHSSHSSGSSSGHYSHSSHSSHTSHYSASPTYTPSNTVPYSAPKPTVITPKKEYTMPRAPSVSPNSGITFSKSLEDYKQGLPDRLLQKGCKGKDVEALQSMLLQLGYDIVVNGFFGDKTEAAVRKFQKDHLISADGKVGRQTWQAIQTALL